MPCPTCGAVGVQGLDVCPSCETQLGQRSEDGDKPVDAQELEIAAEHLLGGGEEETAAPPKPARPPLKAYHSEPMEEPSRRVPLAVLFAIGFDLIQSLGFFCLGIVILKTPPEGWTSNMVYGTSIFEFLLGYLFIRMAMGLLACNRNAYVGQFVLSGIISLSGFICLAVLGEVPSVYGSVEELGPTRVIAGYLVINLLMMLLLLVPAAAETFKEE